MSSTVQSQVAGSAYERPAGAAEVVTPPARVASLDIVRGIAMILMAIDHVRVYSGLPAGGPTPGIFFTRWITHFVAPAFIFLAGTGAYLHGKRLDGKRALSRFLLTRGLWLVLLELTVIRVAWTFNFDFAHYNLAGVIWVIGWSMVVLAAAVHLPTKVVGGIGAAIIALHNLTDLFGAQLQGSFGEQGPNWFLKLLYFGGAVQLGADGPPLLILYVLVPWVGVMMAGYAFGAVMELPAERRRRISLRLGVALTVLFVALRVAGVYGDPRSWTAAAHRMPSYLAFLATNKYPASLEFLAMTLGPTLVVLALSEGWRGRMAKVSATFGRVPFFYYLLHIPLIHLAACLVSLAREGRVNPWLFANHPVAPGPAPAGYAWSLGLLYLVWVLCVATLYFPSRWYARVKAKRRQVWMSYL